MSRFTFLLALISALFIPQSALAAPPGILLIVGDDIGYGDLKFVRVGSDSGLFNVRTDPNESHRPQPEASHPHPPTPGQVKFNTVKGAKP